MTMSNVVNHFSGSVLAGICLLVVLTSCDSQGHKEDVHYHNIQDRIAATSNDSIQHPIDNRDLVNIDYVDVELDEYNGHPFLVEARTPYLLHYECSECHSKPIDELKAEGVQGVKKAHWDVHLKHAGAAVMSCGTCHPSDNLDELKSLENHKISFDHSYQLCGQCHSSQLNDWIGGAHGKRLGGWTEPRIVKTCVGCHNPHNPAFEPRWPARLNTHQILEEQNLETTD